MLDEPGSCKVCLGRSSRVRTPHMHPSTIHLLRSIGRQAICIVAIITMMLSVLRMPCFQVADHASEKAMSVQTSAVKISAHANAFGTHTTADCDFCDCQLTTFCVIPDALSHLPFCSDNCGVHRPISSRVPDSLARTPDVPPDQA